MPSGSYEPLVKTITSGLRGLQTKIERETASHDKREVVAPMKPPVFATETVDEGINNPRIQMDVRKARELRLLRKHLFGKDKVSGAGWDVLLHLFESHVHHLSNTVGNVCDGAEIPSATAARWMTRLEHDELIAITDDRFDGRRRLVELTALGARMMTRYFSRPARLSIDA
jgi:DNA-binding MarR family transcriptional regulator